MTLSVVERHQEDRKQEPIDAILEKSRDSKLRASESGRLAILATLQKELMDWCHGNLKNPGRDRMCLT